MISVGTCGVPPLPARHNWTNKADAKEKNLVNDTVKETVNEGTFTESNS